MKIAVCMAVCNGENWLFEQLTSILNDQDRRIDELFIVDDASDDKSLAIIEQFAEVDNRIKWQSHKKRMGVVATFAEALESCAGDLIFLADQDDIWLPSKAKVMESAFVCDSDLLLAVCDAEIIDANGESMGYRFFDERQRPVGFWENFCQNSFHGCALAFRRDLLQTALPFPSKVAMHDWWLGLCATKQGKVEHLPQVLMQYRRHGKNVTSGKPASWSQRISWRLRLLSSLWGR